MKPIIANTAEYTGNVTFKASSNREYFFVVMTSGEGTIRFGDEGGEIPLALLDHYAPPLAFASEITVTTTGTFVVHTDGSLANVEVASVQFQNGDNFTFQDESEFNFN